MGIVAPFGIADLLVAAGIIEPVRGGHFDGEWFKTLAFRALHAG
jgi:hypothetical protein